MCNKEAVCVDSTVGKHFSRNFSEVTVIGEIIVAIFDFAIDCVAPYYPSYAPINYKVQPTGDEYRHTNSV